MLCGDADFLITKLRLQMHRRQETIGKIARNCKIEPVLFFFFSFPLYAGSSATARRIAQTDKHRCFGERLMGSRNSHPRGGKSIVRFWGESLVGLFSGENPLARDGIFTCIGYIVQWGFWGVYCFLPRTD